MKIIITILFSVLAVQIAASQSKDAIFQDAYQKYEKGQLREASSGFSRVIQMDSLYLEAYVFRGLAQQAMKNHNNAIADYEKAITIAPKDTVLYLMKADLEVEMGENLLSIIDYSSAIALDPYNAEIYRRRAAQYYLLNHYVLALEDFRKAISLEPTDASDFFSAGICLNMVEDYENAINFFSTAAIFEPNESVIYYNRGISHSSVGETKQACIDWQKASELGFDEARNLIRQYCR